MSSLPLAALAAPGGFAPDPRFMAAVATAAAPAAPPDPLGAAWDDGHVAGYAQAAAAAAAAEVLAAEARGRIELALLRLDRDLAEQLRQRLGSAVRALCEASLVPLALDPGMLAARVERATAMLSRADDERVLRLNPDDLDLVAGRLPEGLAVLADPALERGALRLETANGGVEDGPAHWARVIADAVAQC